MTGAQLAAKIRKKTKTNTTSYTDADLLVDINLMKDEIVGKIAAARQESFNISFEENLILNQRPYLFQTDVLNNLVRIEAKFSATGDYVLVDPVHLAQIGIPLQESIIINYYTNEDPKYFVRDKYIYILSGAIILVTDGLRWVYKKFPADLANITGVADLAISTAVLPGVPKEFHELWARRVSIEYKDREGRALSSKELKYEIELQEALDDFAVPSIEGVITGAIPDEGRRSDDGFDY